VGTGYLVLRVRGTWVRGYGGTGYMYSFLLPDATI